MWIGSFFVRRFMNACVDFGIRDKNGKLQQDDGCKGAKYEYAGLVHDLHTLKKKTFSEFIYGR
jgi:hypothetical protein